MYRPELTQIVALTLIRVRNGNLNSVDRADMIILIMSEFNRANELLVIHVSVSNGIVKFDVTSTIILRCDDNSCFFANRKSLHVR